MVDLAYRATRKRTDLFCFVLSDSAQLFLVSRVVLPNFMLWFGVSNMDYEAADIQPTHARESALRLVVHGGHSNTTGLVSREFRDAEAILQMTCESDPQGYYC